MGSIKSGPLPDEDIEAATYWHLGYTVPRRNIDSKFGSYWGTILALATGPASIAATAVLAGALSGWSWGILASGAAACFFLSVLDVFGLATAAVRIQDRQPVGSLLQTQMLPSRTCVQPVVHATSCRCT